MSDKKTAVFQNAWIISPISRMTQHTPGCTHESPQAPCAKEFYEKRL